MQMEDIFDQSASDIEEFDSNNVLESMKPYHDMNEDEEVEQGELQLKENVIDNVHIQIENDILQSQQYIINKKKQKYTINFDDEYSMDVLISKKPFLQNNTHNILEEVQSNKKIKKSFFITANESVKLLTKKMIKLFTIIDCRTFSEFKKGHIIHSIIFKNLEELFAICKNMEIVIFYCDNTMKKSKEIFKKIKQALPNVVFYILKGGYKTFVNEYPFFTKIY